MMRIKLFVAMFLLYLTESVTEFVGWRERSPIRANDVLEVADKLGDIKGFDEMLAKEHGEIVYVIRPGTVGEDVSGVRSLLDLTVFKFMIASQTYVIRYLHAYCDTVIRMLKKNEINGYSVDKIREMIGFPDRHEYCMVTAFYDGDDYLLDVELLLESTFFFQTIGRDGQLTFRDLETQSRYYRQRFNKYRKIYEIKFLGSPGLYSFDDFKSTLNEMKRAITDFSNAFCTRWRPFVSRVFITNPAGSDEKNVQIENLFIRHVLYCEKCLVKTSQEYRFQTYEKDVMDEMCKGPSWKTTVSPSSNVRVEFMREERFSLAALKHDLQRNSYYLNVVKYYNIASYVILLVSIREGNKIFKWIKFVVSNNCNNKHENAVDEMRGLRSTLSAFKAVFDKIVFSLLNDKRINVTENPQKKTFDKQVNALLTLLDIQNNRATNQMQKICKVIPNKLLRGKIYYVHQGVNPNKVKLEQYYGTEPILNVSKLYHYLANDF